MNAKWYIGTLIIILAFIGLNQEQTKVANQQILMQFPELEMTSGSTHDEALATITKKLEVLGIADIEIVKEGDTQLSIRYYSAIDAQSVGEFLSHEVELSLLYTDIDELPSGFPDDELPETCSLVVLDLQQQTDAGLSLGKFAIQLGDGFKKVSNPVIIQLSDSTVLTRNAAVGVAFKAK